MRVTYYEETDSAVIVLRKPGPDKAGEIAGEDLTDPDVEGVVLHRDDAGELYEIEIYGGASGRLDLNDLVFERVPAGGGRGADRRSAVRPEEIFSRDPGAMSGELVFAGTRVEVETLVDHLKAGHPLEEFLDGFPTVTRKQTVAFLEWALDAAQRRAGGEEGS